MLRDLLHHVEAAAAAAVTVSFTLECAVGVATMFVTVIAVNVAAGLALEVWLGEAGAVAVKVVKPRR